MKRRILGLMAALCLLMAALCLLMAAIPAWAEWDGHNMGKVITFYTEVFPLPQPDTTPADMLLQDHDIEMQEERGGWWLIGYEKDGKSHTGWVPGSTVDFVQALPPDVPLDSLRRAVVVSESVTLRGTADASGRKLASIPGGAHGYIVEEQGDWIRVLYLQRDGGYELLEGWIQRVYTVENPDYYTLLKGSQAFALSSMHGPAVAYLDAYTRLIVFDYGQFDTMVGLRGASAVLPGTASTWSEAKYREAPEGGL